MQKYDTVLHQWFEEVWNQGREEAIDEIFPDGIAHGLGESAVRGGEEYKEFFKVFRNALPDIQIIVEDWIADGDRIAVRCRAKGTHQGDGLGFAPTNQPLDFTFMAFARIEDDKIAEAWNVVDFMKMYQQMGVLKLDSQ